MSWLVGAGATVGIVGIAIINAGFFNHKVEKASLSYLSAIQLKALDGSNKLVVASDLWKKNGAVIMVVRRPGCFLCREVLHDWVINCGVPKMIAVSVSFLILLAGTPLKRALSFLLFCSFHNVEHH